MIPSILRPSFSPLANRAGAGLLGILFLCAMPVTSHAGFDWTPPPKTAQTDIPLLKTGPGAALPADAVMMEPLLEEYQGSEFSPIEKQLIGPDGRVLSELPGQTYEVIQGFGSDLPLALAMQQIVPPAYAYSFDKGVDPSVNVSWNGGKPWNIVLKEAVAPYGLDVVISDQTAWLLPASVVAAHNAQEIAVDMPAKDHAIAALKQEVYADPTIAGIQAEPLMPMALAEEEEPKAVTVTEPEKERLRRIGMDESTYSPSYLRRDPSSVERAAPQRQVQAQAPTSLAPQPAKVKTAVAATGSTSFDIKDWKASQGESLYDILNRWSEKASVTLLWQGDQDYRLPGNIEAQGSYPDAVTAVLAMFDDRTTRPTGRLHTNQPQGPVLVISPEDSY